MTQFAICGIQMHVSMNRNIEEMRSRLHLMKYLYPWVQMAVFSELAVHGPNAQSAEPSGGEVETELCALAKQYDIWLIPGSLFEERDGKVYNTTPVINPAGEVVTRYRKMFPFTPYEKHTTPGTEFCVFDVPDVGRFGVLICYDIWFPEVARTLTTMGAEVLINPVLTGFIDRPSDLNIAQASASMFQSYVFHINGLYTGGNGQSLVIDPAGQILHRGGSQEELIPVEVDFDLVRRQRRRGVLNMGQPLKSFRDTAVDFTVYQPGFDRSYLDNLGELRMPGRPGTASDGT